MNDISDTKKAFLAKSPSLSEILAFIEEQAQLEAKRRKTQAQGET